MKAIQFVLGCVMVCAIMNSSFATTSVPRDSTGVPGDNFSLEGALEMFRKAESPEEFEKMINTEDKQP
jgi:hypothetical protein